MGCPCYTSSMARFLVVAALVWVMSPAVSFAVKPKPRLPASPPAAAKPPVATEGEESELRFQRYRLNNFMGYHKNQSSALVIGAQFAFALKRNTPFYLGPEVNFSLFPTGNMSMTLLAAWYELALFDLPRLTFCLGAAVGPAFSSKLANLGSVTYAALLEASLAQDLDDLVTLKAQLRPGVVGGYFDFMVNFNISFRFI